jgi:hypothetical protein
MVYGSADTDEAPRPTVVDMLTLSRLRLQTRSHPPIPCEHPTRSPAESRLITVNQQEKLRDRGTPVGRLKSQAPSMDCLISCDRSIGVAAQPASP